MTRHLTEGCTRAALACPGNATFEQPAGLPLVCGQIQIHSNRACCCARWSQFSTITPPCASITSHKQFRLTIHQQFHRLSGQSDHYCIMHTLPRESVPSRNRRSAHNELFNSACDVWASCEPRGYDVGRQMLLAAQKDMIPGQRVAA